MCCAECDSGSQAAAAIMLAVTMVNVMAIIYGDDVDESCGGDRR